MTINNINSAALEMLFCVREVFPGAMLGGSSVYAPREGEDQDWDFFLPTDMSAEEVVIALKEQADVDIRYRHRIVSYVEDRVTMIGPEKHSQGGLVVVRRPYEGDANYYWHTTAGEEDPWGRQWDFVLVTSEHLKGRSLVEWMDGFQPIRQQRALCDGKEVFLSESLDTTITVDLNKVHTLGQLRVIQARAQRMGRENKAEVKYLGYLEGSVVADLFMEEEEKKNRTEEEISRAKTEAVKALEGLRQEFDQKEVELLTAEKNLKIRAEDARISETQRKLLTTLIFGAILALAIIF